MARGKKRNKSGITSIRLDPTERWYLDELSAKENRSYGNLIKLWISDAAEEAGLTVPKEMKEQGQKNAAAQ